MEFTRRNFLKACAGGVGGSTLGVLGFPSPELLAQTHDAARADEAALPKPAPHGLLAQKTRLLVRPAARGGKYLGHDAADGWNFSAIIWLTRVDTGELAGIALARAPDKASAGPADLMAAQSRSQPYAADAQTVEVQFELDIASPTVFRVHVYGPLKHPDQARLAEADITLLPGVDVGTTQAFPEGVVVEVPGLCISDVKAQWQGDNLSCEAMVTMMCGCEIGDAAGWPWPYTDFNIRMVTCMASGAVHSYEMSYGASQASTFKGAWASKAAKGDTPLEVWVWASEPKLGNQGGYRIHPSPWLPVALPGRVAEFLAKARGG